MDDMKKHNGSNPAEPTPDGWATVTEIVKACGVCRKTVLRTVDDTGMRTRPWGRTIIVDLDDWYLHWTPKGIDDVPEKVKVKTYLPHRGMTTCPRCGVRWRSPDRIRHRYCKDCRVSVRRSALNEDFAVVACLGDGLAGGQWKSTDDEAQVAGGVT